MLFQKNLVLTFLALWELGSCQVISKQGFVTIGCDLSHAFSYSRLGAFMSKYDIRCA